ncbi:hypothetical protein C7B82_13580 [Stenomitos frigidus ULC18]|uniref:Transposase n=1 Tax=Stenomitos frigidus ULC18 TaxID=2107698 RepID=A0A2T1E6X5_9CYAN|nr:hypothetical protein C7B82_13580 [Stenomitos frigidus ULC18]
MSRGKRSPPHLLSDEKHTWWLGERVYVATTVATGCISGAELSPTAGTEDLHRVLAQVEADLAELQKPISPTTVTPLFLTEGSP